MTIGLLQFVQPFLKHYMVWVVMLFLTGACVGGGVTNTNYALSEDFRKAGVPDSVRSFAMSFAGVGNFGGDATGGALGVMVQQIATKALQKRT
jgi:MFS family permease